jgi:hypothetical protein
MDRYSDTDNRKGREQLRLNLHPPRQISTLPLSRGFPRRTRLRRHPLISFFESTTICAVVGMVRQSMGDAQNSTPFGAVRGSPMEVRGRSVRPANKQSTSHCVRPRITSKHLYEGAVFL